MGTACTKGLAAIFKSCEVISVEKNCDSWLATPYTCAIGIIHDCHRLKDALVIAV
jgi:hypothetical protein